MKMLNLQFVMMMVFFHPMKIRNHELSWRKVLILLLNQMVNMMIMMKKMTQHILRFSLHILLTGLLIFQ
jgi:hypothetical protein